MRLFDVTKIASIEKDQFTAEFLKAIEGCGEYSDNSLDEDLFSPDDLGEYIDEEHMPELLKVKALCDRYDCAYFRVIEP